MSQKFTGLKLSRVLSSFKFAALTLLDLTVGDLSGDSSGAVGVEGERFGVDSYHNSGISSLVSASSDSSEAHISAQNHLRVRAGFQAVVYVKAQSSFLGTVYSVGLLMSKRLASISVFASSFHKRDSIAT